MSEAPGRLVGILLAAGGSSRMGRPKALLAYPGALPGRLKPAPPPGGRTAGTVAVEGRLEAGRTQGGSLTAQRAGRGPAPRPGVNFLQACIAKLLAVCEAVFVILPPGAAGAALRTGAGLAGDDPRLCWLENPDPRWGQFSSLQIGAAAALASGAGAVMVAAVDRPMFAAATARVLAAAPPAAIVKPAYQGRHGHPVRYGAELLAAIVAAPAEATAREVGRGFAASIVETGDPGILMNVDTPQDYERLCREWRARAR